MIGRREGKNAYPCVRIAWASFPTPFSEQRVHYTTTFTFPELRMYVISSSGCGMGNGATALEAKEGGSWAGLGKGKKPNYYGPFPGECLY